MRQLWTYTQKKKGIFVSDWPKPNDAEYTAWSEKIKKLASAIQEKLMQKLNTER